MKVLTFIELPSRSSANYENQKFDEGFEGSFFNHDEAEDMVKV